MDSAGEQYVAKSAEEMDEERQQQIAYQYLCHLEEAKTWMERCLNEKLPNPTELEDFLRNGVILAKLSTMFAPSVVKTNKIFDIDEHKYRENGLHFRHTDNINYFLSSLRFIGLPEIFMPETFDVYDKKNMPRVIFCIHALSLYLYQKGIFKHRIQDLYGKVTFTQEQISAMRQALEAVGLPMMPQFRRIGGMLADEVPVDDAALHAAILAINEALDNQDPELVLFALQNTNACLTDIDETLLHKYYVVLIEKKSQKLRRNCENFAIDGDAYDEMLTRDEIQEVITKINLIVALERVEKCVRDFDLHNLKFSLMSRHINLKSTIKSDKLEKYCVCLANILSNSDENFLSPEDIERVLSRVNSESSALEMEEEIVSRVNDIVVNRGDENKLIELLRNPIFNMNESIQHFAGQLYLSELEFVRESVGKDLSKPLIIRTCKFLESVAKINFAVRSRDVATFWACASGPKPALVDLKEHLCNQYFEVIHAALKVRCQATSWMMNVAELQECVDQVNISNNLEMRCISAIENVNSAVKANNHQALYEAIHSPELNLQSYVNDEELFVNNKLFLTEDDAFHFLHLLKEMQQNRSLAENEETSIWMENILDALRLCFKHRKEANSATFALAIVNMAILQKDAQNTFETLKHKDLFIPASLLRQEFADDYQRELYANSKSIGNDSGRSPWVRHQLRSGDQVYLNLQKHIFSWRPPKHIFSSHSMYLSVGDIIKSIESVNAAKDEDFNDDLQIFITQLQARCRGFITRQKIFTMLEHYYQNEDKVVKIQALWRGILQRRQYKKLLQKKRSLKTKSGSTTRLKSIEYYKLHTKKIIRIQKFWRAYHYKKQLDELSLKTSSEIKISTLRQFLHLLDLRSEDFEQELELQSLKGQISQLIRNNQALEKDLDAMDIKIGLLIKNRIDLDEVVAHNKLLISRKKSFRNIVNGVNLGNQEGFLPGMAGSSTLPRGLKALKKESRNRLDAYQHLFYRLQTCPEYLAKLIFVLPQSSSNKFIDSVIMTLYNFGSNPREEFMLLKLFQTALEEEVQNKVHQLNDIVSGSPLVIKMIVQYYRSKGSLRELLEPLIRGVLDDKNVHINLIPVEIYKHWVNSLEFESGRPSDKPYDVSTEEALKHSEVVNRFNKSVIQVKQLTTMFLATIVKAKANKKLPYGLLYLSKVLYQALKKKFPNHQDKDFYKVVGNLIYYRYINSAIVAPDVFGIVDKASLEDKGGLNQDQRRTLGNIAKILQFAAAKKGFGDECSYLGFLNSYIIECHEKFKKFFKDCCTADDIAEPSEAFAVDQYSEAALIAKPVIYISLQEICDTHQLLLENIDIIAPDKKDKLRELLDDLGESSSILSLMGAAPNPDTWQDGSLSHLGKTEVCLTLTNKFALESAVDRANIDRLFVKTKQLITAVLPYTKESNLIGCLKSPTTQEQSELYWELMDYRMALDEKAEQNKKMLDHTNLFADDESRPSLEECKVQILKNLQVLERHGSVSSKDGCQTILLSIAKDICNQKEYRTRRRREIFKLRKIIRSLQAKSKFHEEQISHYNTYIKQCLMNLQQAGASKKRVRFHNSDPQKARGDFSRKVEEKTIRYTASKLYQKGVLISIEGLPQTHLQNVLFEFVTFGDGIFSIHAKFMGIGLEHVEIDIQDLLQMQYEGASVINMFGKVKINVNLFLHFLNRKFYGRKF